MCNNLKGGEDYLVNNKIVYKMEAENPNNKDNDVRGHVEDSQGKEGRRESDQSRSALSCEYLGTED